MIAVSVGVQGGAPGCEFPPLQFAIASLQSDLIGNLFELPLSFEFLLYREQQRVNMLLPIYLTDLRARKCFGSHPPLFCSAKINSRSR